MRAAPCDEQPLVGSRTGAGCAAGVASRVGEFPMQEGIASGSQGDPLQAVR